MAQGSSRTRKEKATAKEQRVLPRQLARAGKDARKAVPRASLGEWVAAADRPDPVEILRSQEADRVPELVPIRYERMSESAFAFYRGAAAIMAEDLRPRPQTGLIAQLAGDAHLANFGGFATSERSLIFDLNDFDETVPGPFEWDVMRLVASFQIAAEHRRMPTAQQAEVVRAVAEEYRVAMAEFARMSRLDVWYARMQAEDILERWAGLVDEAHLQRFRELIAKGRKKTSARAVSRYSRPGPDGTLQVVADPPFVVPISQLAGDEPGEARRRIVEAVAAYRESLSDDMKILLDGYRIVDIARKVVGVGSVGTRCWIVLLVGVDDASDDLVLQVKQAGPSVLEVAVQASRYANHGERVVQGQRLMQASSDMLLGWTRTMSIDGVERDYYVRQMWDWKTSPDLETMDAESMGVYARICGWTLARAHARSGNRYAIAAYVGSGKAFVEAMAAFAVAYAEQNRRDYEAFGRAIESGRIQRSTAQPR